MYLYGGSGHCKVIIDTIKKSKEFLIEGIFDDHPKFKAISDITVLKTEEPDFFKDKQIVISIGDNKMRKKIAEKIKAFYVKIIHPNAVIALDAKILEGTVVMAGAIVNASVKIGKHCIVNTGSVVEHDCEIDDYCHISPNASLAGNIIVGEGTHIGIGACIIQGVKIGKWVTIGAGSIILKDVPDFAVVVGNPGKIIKFNKAND